MQKPFTPASLYEQRCFSCNKPLKHGDPAIAHMYQPLAWCVECMGEEEKKSPVLCKAKIFDPKD